MSSVLARLAGSTPIRRTLYKAAQGPAQSRIHPERGLQEAIQARRGSKNSPPLVSSFLFRGQRYALIHNSLLKHARNYHTSRQLLNTGEQASGQSSSSSQQKPQTEGPSWAPQGASVVPDWPPFGKWPYAFIGLAAAAVFMFGYTCFIMREEKMIERYEFLKWGGELDRVHSLTKLRKYLVYDQFGIPVSTRMSDFGLADVTLRALNDESPRVRQLALEVFCAFTANPKLRPYLRDELKALDVLRRFADSRNLYMWYAVANLVEDKEEVVKEIAKDEYFMESLMYMYERSLRMQDLYYLRPLLRLLANLARVPEASHVLSTTYLDKMRELLNVQIMPETQSLTNNVNLRFYLAKNDTAAWPDVVAELQEHGIVEPEKPTLLKWSLIHQGMAVGAAAVVWSLFRGKRLSQKHYPLNRNERQWINKAIWRTPLTAIALSYCWNATEQVCMRVSEMMEPWEGFRDARKIAAPYFALLPIYWVALNYLGPFATIPSLVRIRYNENIPPYNFMLREPMLDVMEAVGLVEDRHADPMNPDRPTSALVETFLESHQTKLKIKQEAEAERKSSWKLW